MLKIGDKEINGRFTIPSGIITTTADSILRVANEIPEIGIITTKSVGPVEKEGNREPILASLGEGTFINAVGLANPGAEEFASEIREIYPLPNGKFLLTSIFGSTAEELQKVAKTVAPYSDGLELNFSCPHAGSGYGLAIGSSPELTEEMTRAVKSVVSIPVFVKLPPLIESVEAVTLAALKGGADGITAVNTFGPNQTDLLSLGKGGMSGRILKKKGLACMQKISEVVHKFEREKEKKITIIAVGGIESAQDIKEYAKYGAEFFGVGSALAGMNNRTLKKYFAVLEKRLQNYDSLFEPVFPETESRMKYEAYTITGIERLADDLKIFHFNRNIKAEPGQFIFAKVDRHEKPFSIANDNPLALLVRKVGTFTSRLFELKEGDEVQIRGPYGKGFATDQAMTAVLVGGGCGVAPLFFLAKGLSRRGRKVFVFIGGKAKDQIAFMQEFKSLQGCLCFVSTDDGSEGERGFVTDMLGRWLYGEGKNEDSLSFYNCGPEIMISKVMEIEKKANPELIESSIERYTKCGVGLCGSCTMDGIRTCVDGPVFDNSFLSSSKHFGRFKRTASARLVKI
jgi:dihydroorotate dehydrogenase (NAD+) catalytic subunit